MTTRNLEDEMTDDPKKDDELAALIKKEVAAELERRAKPPEPFTPAPYQRWDPTANMTMPLSTLRDMCNAVPDSVMRGVIHDNRAPTGRPGMIPEQPSRGSNVVRGTGWVDAPPLRPPPGVAQADKIVDEFDRRDRAELAQRLGALKR
jgi:hypothetical protein